MDTRTRYTRMAATAFFVALLIFLAACGTNPGQGQPRATVTPTATPVVQGTTPTPTPTPLPSSHKEQPTEKRQAEQQPSRPGVPPAPISRGKVILVSLANQWLYAYENGQLIFDNAVETGRPELPTPSGWFSVLSKQRNITFTSPWPPGSPYYYGPTFINYALLFKSGGFFLHDAWWHVVFGPGGNVPHRLSNGSWETGSHGCVGMTIPDARRLYEWAPVGTPVIIR